MNQPRGRMSETKRTGENAVPFETTVLNELGLSYNGIQKIDGWPDQLVLTDNVTHGTFLAATDVSAKTLRVAVNRIRRSFVVGGNSVGEEGAKTMGKGAFMPGGMWQG